MNNKKKLNNESVTEIMTENRGKQGFSVIKNEDRTGDGNLLPEVRERIIKELKIYLQQVGYINISEIASMINLSRQTIKKLVNEVTESWEEDSGNQIIVQKKWHESIIQDIENNPDLFCKEYTNIIRLKSMMLGKINSLHKLSQKESASKHRIINVYLAKQDAQKKPLKLKNAKKENPP